MTLKPNKLRTTLPIIEVNDIVIVHVDKLPRSQCKSGLVTELIPSRDTKGREEKVRLSKSNTIITRPVNKLYLSECLNKNSTSATINKDTVQTNTKPKCESALCVQHRRVYSMFRLRIYSSFITLHLTKV